jgi:predicted permease
VLAGLLLGPSFFGRIAPAAAAFVFPPSITPILGVIAQVGVLLFMFVVGLELNTTHSRERTHPSTRNTSEWAPALAISHASILAPFLLGAVIPRDSRAVRDLTERLEDFVVVLLLPIFFAFTGLRTQIGLISGGSQWLLCAAILLAACVGKLSGTAVVARLTGLGWRDAAALVILMNTRGHHPRQLLARVPGADRPERRARPARDLAAPVRDAGAHGGRDHLRDHADPGSAGMGRKPARHFDAKARPEFGHPHCPE